MNNMGRDIDAFIHITNHNKLVNLSRPIIAEGVIISEIAVDFTAPVHIYDGEIASPNNLLVSNLQHIEVLLPWSTHPIQDTIDPHRGVVIHMREEVSFKTKGSNSYDQVYLVSKEFRKDFRMDIPETYVPQKFIVSTLDSNGVNNNLLDGSGVSLFDTPHNMRIGIHLKFINARFVN